MYSIQNSKTKEEQTADPSKYPQGYFKPKPCRGCSEEFDPRAPSELYCSDTCKDEGIQSAYLRRNYGIDLPEYRRMLAEQRHRCKICGGEGFVMCEKKHKIKLVVDHCHDSGKVRGLLCHNCNRALGLLKDDAQTLLNAIDYLNV